MSSMDCVDRTCRYCGKKLKPLFNVTLWCPDDCDRLVSPGTKWYSFYHISSVGYRVDKESYLTMDVELCKKKAKDMGGKAWEVELEANAVVQKTESIPNVYNGGPVRLVRLVE
jgi:hypothetical protein